MSCSEFKPSAVTPPINTNSTTTSATRRAKIRVLVNMSSVPVAGEEGRRIFLSGDYPNLRDCPDLEYVDTSLGAVTKVLRSAT